MVILITSLVAFHAEGADLRHVYYEEVLGLEFHLRALYTQLCSQTSVSSIISSGGSNMAAVKTTTKTSTIVPILHLVFTIVSIMVLSYKVYHVESELSFIRDELSTHDRGNGLDKTPVHSTAAAISETSGDKRSDRNRRLSQERQKTTSAKQTIHADCLQKALKDFQV